MLSKSSTIPRNVIMIMTFDSEHVVMIGAQRPLGGANTLSIEGTATTRAVLHDRQKLGSKL